MQLKMSQNSCFDPSNFRSSDLQKYLDALSNHSTAHDEMTAILKNLLFFITQGDENTAIEILGKGIVTILTNLYVRYSNSNLMKSKITSFLILLGQKENERNNGVVIDSLAHMFTGSNFNVFLECLNGMKQIAGISEVKEGDGGGGGGKEKEKEVFSSNDELSPPQPHFLSVSGATAILIRITTFLTSSQVRDAQKFEALDVFMELVDSFMLNQAAEFSVWAQSNSKKENPAYTQFASAYLAFSNAIKELASGKKRSGLCMLAERIHSYINENKFFPTEVSVSVPIKGEISKAMTLSLPLKFMVNSAANSGITRGDAKISWGSTNGWATFFVDQEMVKGLYKVEIEADCTSSNMDYTWLGLCLKSQLSALAGRYGHGKKDTYFLHHSGFYDATSNWAFNGTGMVWSNNIRTHVIGLELNVDKGILHVFVDGVQIPYSVTKVPKSVYFAVSSYINTQVFEIKSFQKLSSPTINPSLSCNSYEWK